jgi:repressor of nif and glnA expression
MSSVSQIDALKTRFYCHELTAKLKTKLAERTIRLELAKLKDKGLIITHGKTKSIVFALVTIRQ